MLLGFFSKFLGVFNLALSRRSCRGLFNSIQSFMRRLHFTSEIVCQTVNQMSH